jgi:hypothetical protein
MLLMLGGEIAPHQSSICDFFSVVAVFHPHAVVGENKNVAVSM